MNSLFAFGMPGLPELLLIGVVVLVFFGPKKLPELARGLGQSLKEFQKAKDEFQDQIHGAATPEGQAPATAAHREAAAPVAEKSSSAASPT